MGMTKVYAVTDGSYSDYHVVGIYSTPELAAEAQAAHQADNIKEYELDAHIDLIRSGLRYWLVCFVGQSADANYVNGGSFEPPEEEVREVMIPAGSARATPYLFVVALAKNEGDAVKIANEKRAIYWASRVEASNE